MLRAQKRNEVLKLVVQMWPYKCQKGWRSFPSISTCWPWFLNAACCSVTLHLHSYDSLWQICWLLLITTCPSCAEKWMCSAVFLRTEVELIDLQFPRCSFWPFSELDVASVQSAETLLNTTSFQNWWQPQVYQPHLSWPAEESSPALWISICCSLSSIPYTTGTGYGSSFSLRHKVILFHAVHL